MSRVGGLRNDRSAQGPRGEPGKSATEAFLLRDSGHLYVGLRCAGNEAVKAEGKAGESSKAAEFAELLIDSMAIGIPTT